MLADEGSKSVMEIYDAVPLKTKKVLHDLEKSNLISVKRDKVNITTLGSELVSRLRKNYQNR
jgi:predicted methyltransferase